MARNFCWNCGSPLSEHDRFCPHCGKEVPAPSDVSAESSIPNSPDADTTVVMNPVPDNASAVSAEQAGADRPASNKPDTEEEMVILDQTPTADQTVRLDPVSSSSASDGAFALHPATSDTSNAAFGQLQAYRAVAPQPEKRGVPQAAVAAIVALIVVAALAFVIVTMVLPRINTTDDSGDIQRPDQQQATQDLQGQSSQEGSQSSQEENQSSTSTNKSTLDAQTENNYYNHLLDTYQGISTLDSKVSDAATEFNDLYASSDYAARTAAAVRAEQTAKDIQDEVDALAELRVNSSSVYYRDAQNLSMLLEYLQHRIAAINSAWEVDLKYSDPAGYEQEITEPISRDKVDGKNRYKTEFDKLYPQARVTRK